MAGVFRVTLMILGDINIQGNEAVFAKSWVDGGRLRRVQMLKYGIGECLQITIKYGKNARLPSVVRVE
jgi:hypothetical protein